MPARILAIECPICGSPQKIEVRPGDGFSITTNDNKSRFYFPLIHKLYADVALSQELRANAKPTEVEKTGFAARNTFMSVQGYSMEQIECYDDDYLLILLRTTAFGAAGHLHHRPCGTLGEAHTGHVQREVMVEALLGSGPA